MVALLADRPPRPSRSPRARAGPASPQALSLVPEGERPALRVLPHGEPPRLRLVADGETLTRPSSARHTPGQTAARSAPARPARRQSAAVYWRRRAVAAVLLFAAVWLLIAVCSALAGTSGGPLTTTGAAAGVVPATARVWVVRPGDTLWSIATRLHPRGDVRPLVDRLAAEVGNTSLYPGEQIPIPSTR
jgi:LysM domain